MSTPAVTSLAVRSSFSSSRGEAPARDPADLAFDPQHQTAYVEGVVVQRPAVVVLDTVPITAGPTVPIIKIDDAQLRAVPSKRWEVVDRSCAPANAACTSSRPAPWPVMCCKVSKAARPSPFSRYT